MDKNSHSSSNESLSDSNNNNNRDQYLKHLNKLSHKISKPTLKKPTFDLPQPLPHAPEHAQSLPHAPPQHQPPVYNINKNDFREVVQKLTGSPAHERLSSPPPIQPPKPPSSRLQRIRPPPLVHLSPRPLSLLHGAAPTTQTLNPNANPNPIPFENPISSLNPNPNGRFAPTFNSIQRPSAPLSPLPPFPTVHASAESPVTAHLRFIHNSTSDIDLRPPNRFSGFSPLLSPKWNNPTAPPPPIPPPPPAAPTTNPQFQLPLSPLPFGCFNSPLSPYPLLSPTSGQLGFPHSPTVPVPVPSPRFRG